MAGREHDYRAGAVLEEQARLAVPEKGWLKGYVTWASGATDANLAYHLVAGLTVLTQSVPLDYSVPIGALPVYMPLYGLLVGDSTESRKTTSIGLAQKILRLALPEQEGSPFGSAESIVDELAHKQQQIVYWPEYSAFLAQAERGYANAMKTKLTEAYDCLSLGRTKANRKGVTVSSPRLTLLCGIAPGYLERHTEPVDWSEGYLGRHTTILANRERYVENPEPDDALEARLVAWLQTVVAATMPQNRYDNGSTFALAVCRGMTDAAAKVRAEWQTGIARVVRSLEHKGILPGIGRAAGMVTKVCGLLAWDWGIARQGVEWRIDDEIMLAATRIVDLHVQSVLAISEWLAPDKAMRDRRKVLRLINGAPIRRGAIIRDAQLLKREADHILATLIEEGTIKVETTMNAEPYYVLVENVRGAHYDPASPEAKALVIDPDAFD